MVATSWSVYYHGFRLKDLLTEGIGAGLLCSQAALLTHGITDAVTWGVVRPAPLVWAVWGIAVAAWYTQER
jgi:putative inorganic carbon (HCO3(-)) transporter